METLTYDIETIPDPSLSPLQEEELQKRLERHKNFNSDTGQDDNSIKRMLAATNPFLGKIICIGLMKTNSKGQYDTLSLTGDEHDILKRFWEILAKFTGLFISYNGLNFDVPFILKRSMVNDLTPTNTSFLDTRRFSKHPHFDVRQILADFNPKNYVTLELACGSLGIKSPKSGEVKAENVEEAYNSGRIDEIAEYCIKDVKATHSSYLIVRNYTFMPQMKYSKKT